MNFANMCYISRGYSSKLIDKHTAKVQEFDRETLITKKIKQTKKKERIPLVTTYNGGSGIIANIIHKQWHVLRDCYKIEAFKEPPLLSYRRSPNLKDKLIKSMVKPKRNKQQKQRKTGCFPCYACNNCDMLMKGEFSVHPTTGIRIRINHP